MLFSYDAQRFLRFRRNLPCAGIIIALRLLYHARRERSAATAAFTSQAVDQRYNLRAAEQPSGLDCTHVQSLYQKSVLISVCFCKISVAIRKYLRIPLIFAYYDKLTHLIYLHFSLLPYTCAGLYGYYFFSFICTVFFPWLYGYNLLSFICTVFFPWLYGYHFFSFICTVFFPWLYGYHFFSFICTVFFPGLYGYYFFSFICTVFFPGLYGYYFFSFICTVFFPGLYGYYSFSPICTVFL